MFQLEIHVPETYPFNPPKVKFLTKIWHPNISSVTGAICLDILKDNWAAAMTLRTVLLSLQALLASAEPDDPQDAVVATQYKDNFEMFCRTAKHWTNSYAKGKLFIVALRRDSTISHLFFQGHTSFQISTQKSSASKIWAFPNSKHAPLFHATTGTWIALPNNSSVSPFRGSTENPFCFNVIVRLPLILVSAIPAHMKIRRKLNLLTFWVSSSEKNYFTQFFLATFCSRNFFRCFFPPQTREFSFPLQFTRKRLRRTWR